MNGQRAEEKIATLVAKALTAPRMRWGGCDPKHLKPEVKILSSNKWVVCYLKFRSGNQNRIAASWIPMALKSIGFKAFFIKNANRDGVEMGFLVDALNQLVV